MAKSYNVVRDYDWTSIPRGSNLRSNAPRVKIQSFKINSSESINRIRSYLNAVSSVNADEFYNKLYGGIASPDDTFIFPFLNDSVRSFSNEYGDTFQSACDKDAGAKGGKTVEKQTNFNHSTISVAQQPNLLNIA
jgi:hypothetical protein